METKEIFWKVIKRFKEFQGSLIIICISFILMTLFSFIYPIIVRNITDKGMIDKNFQNIFIYSLILLLVLIFEQLISLFQMHLCVSLKNQFQGSMFYDAFSKILRLKMDYFENKNSTEVINKLNTDIQAVSIIADNSIMNIVNYLLRIVSGSIGLFVIDKRLALAVFAFVPLKFILVIQTSKKKKMLTSTYIEKLRAFSAWFSDMVNGIREIKLWNLYEIKKKYFFKKQDDVIQSNIKSTILDAYNASGDSILNAILTCALYFIGGFMVCQDSLSIGSVIAFLSYSMYVTGPISTLFNMKYLFSGIAPSAQRLFSFLDLEEEVKNESSKKLQEFQSLVFENISYNYDNNIILQNINLNIMKGNKVAIIGKNGSGKTTILKLLLQIINPLSGNIVVNDNKISEYNLDDYRNLFSVISQDVYLFQDTISNNIDIQKKYTEEEILIACKRSCLEEFLHHLPNGLNTLIENNGANLSGGERGKIAIARAFVKKSQILILDEVSSNLDVESNQILFKTLISDFNDKTIIMITHDYAQLEKMDMVYKLKNGKLVRIK